MNNLIKHPAGTTYIHPLKKGDLITITKKYPIGDDIYIFTGYFYRFSNYAIDKDTIIISRKKSILNDDIIYGDFEEILIKYISQIIVYEA